MTKRSGDPCLCPSKHYGRCRGDDKARLRNRVVVAPNGCWLWQGEVNAAGYGRFWWDGHSGAAHRAAYELFNGPIPSGMQVDHICHNGDTACPGGEDCTHRACVNPEHLEAVSPKTNVRRAPQSPAGINHRKTHCARGGHPLSGPNLYVSPQGKRECRICRNAATAAYQTRVRMKVA